MNSERADPEHISKQFFAALSGIAKGMTLREWVEVPGDYGRAGPVQIDKALAAAASGLTVAIPDDHLDLVKQACKKVDIDPPSNQMNEIARAIFDAMRTKNR